VLVCVELSDILFAVDSIPAVFGVTTDPFIAFTSNIFAIIGLRSLYSVLANAVQDLEYLEKSVAIVLGFVGVKLLAEGAGAHLDPLVSLAVVGSVLTTGIGLSLVARAEQEAAERKKLVAGGADVDIQPPVPVFVKASRAIESKLSYVWTFLTGEADGDASAAPAEGACCAYQFHHVVYGGSLLRWALRKDPARVQKGQPRGPLPTKASRAGSRP